MEYVTLNKGKYKPGFDVEKEYAKRHESFATYKLPLTKKGYDYNTQYDLFVYSAIELNELIYDILHLDGLVCHIINQLPSVAVRQYINSRLLFEVEHTNLIEGVRSSRVEIKEAIDNLNGSKKKKFEALAKKYNLLATSNPYTYTIPLRNSADIRALYDEILLDEVVEEDPADFPDGMIFRKGEVGVETATQRVIHTGVLPESRIIQNVDELLDFLNTYKCNNLLKVAVFHYYMGYIHPFYDGNGRLIRFITTYLLLKTLNPVSPFNLSMTIEENKKAYERAFDEANSPNNRGDITSFCIEFFKILKESMDKTLKALYEKHEALEYYRRKIKMIDTETVKKDIIWILVQVYLFNDDETSVERKFLLDILKETTMVKMSEGTLRVKLNELSEAGLIDISKPSKQYLYSISKQFIEE